MASRNRTIATRIGAIAAAVAVGLLTAWLLTGLYAANRLVEGTVASWERNLEVQAFLDDGLTPDQLAALERAIKANPQVRSLSYISKEAALQEFIDLNTESPAVYANVDKDALPASFRIQLRSSNGTEALATRLDDLSGVDEVNVPGNSVGKMLTVTKFVRVGVFVLMIGLGVLATAFILSRVRPAFA